MAAHLIMIPVAEPVPQPQAVPAQQRKSLFDDRETAANVSQALANHASFLQLFDSDAQGGELVMLTEHISEAAAAHLANARAGDHLRVHRRNVRIHRADVLSAIGSAVSHSSQTADMLLRLATTVLNLENAAWDGEHLVVSYSHHGIVLSSGEVVHFTSNRGDHAFDAAVTTFRITPFAGFLGAAPLEDVEVVSYERAHARDVSVHLALLMVHEFPQLARYHPLTFNCEHFATVLREGQLRSAQVDELEARIRSIPDHMGQAVVNGAQAVVSGVEGVVKGIGGWVQDNPASALSIGGLILGLAQVVAFSGRPNREEAYAPVVPAEADAANADADADAEEDDAEAAPAERQPAFSDA